MQHNLPSVFLDAIQQAKGYEAKAFLEAHQAEKQIVSVRLNPAKKFNLADSVLDTRKRIPWSTNGYYLHARPSFTADPLFHSGAYYVQEASSMFLEQVLLQTSELNTNIKVLDLCAAPGGKSTLIQSLITPESLLVSNEVIKTRVNILSENSTKWGSINTIVTNNDPKDFQKLPDYFDVILVDAPCSGSGLFRKDPAAINEWSKEQVEVCAKRQQRILSDIISSLKPGGTLIYATCSFSEQENECISDWLVDQHPVESIQLQLNTDWNIVETISDKAHAFGYRFYPDKLEGEGFFISAFKKNIHTEQTATKKNNNQLDPVNAAQLNSINEWVDTKQPTSFFRWKEEVIAIPTAHLSEVALLQKTLYLKKVGVMVGSMVRYELIPGHELALSNLIGSKVSRTNLDLDTALQYLRRADFTLETSQKGWSLFQFGGLPIGFAKILPNRINNYYPKEWRILNK